jgi:hypothetical protein
MEALGQQSKTETSLFDKFYFIRLEAWDHRGNNLGFIAHELFRDNLEEAIAYARTMFVEYWPSTKLKQIHIRVKGELIWHYHKNRITTYVPDK